MPQMPLIKYLRGLSKEDRISAILSNDYDHRICKDCGHIDKQHNHHTPVELIRACGECNCSTANYISWLRDKYPSKYELHLREDIPGDEKPFVAQRKEELLRSRYVAVRNLANIHYKIMTYFETISFHRYYLIDVVLTYELNHGLIVVPSSRAFCEGCQVDFKNTSKIAVFGDFIIHDKCLGKLLRIA